MTTSTLRANTGWTTETFGRSRPAVPTHSAAPKFTAISSLESGLLWTNRLSVARYSERQNLMNGAGVAVGDIDQDGLPDLFLCNREGGYALFRNLGHWRYQDETFRLGPAATNTFASGAVFADTDGDGWIDLLVTHFFGPHRSFRNIGQGRFQENSAEAGLSPRGGATSAALADLDGDGDLDLYVCYFGVEAILREGVSFTTRTVRGQPVVMGRYAKRLTIQDGRVLELGEPDLLYLNEGGGRFRPVEWAKHFVDERGQPMAAPPDFGLAVQIRDINQDGSPDLYVCNDFQSPDRCWLNNGRGQFRPIEPLALRNMSYASMGVDFADIDRDGWLDFVTVEMLSRDYSRHLRQEPPARPDPRKPGVFESREAVTRNTLYWNRGNGTYAEIAWAAGLAASDWSWTPMFLDVDLDGFEDLLVTTGHFHDVNDRDSIARRGPSTGGAAAGSERLVLADYPPLRTANAAFRNTGQLRFDDVSERWGFAATSICHGMAAGDFDGDGDQDIVINRAQETPLLLRNDSAAPRIAVRLRGQAPNSQGIGASIRVEGGPVTQSQEILSGGRYLSSDDPVRTFATGSPSNQVRLHVRWPSGRNTVVPAASPNRLYEIHEPAGPIPPPSHTTVNISAPAPSPWFEDRSAALDHRHQEVAFDDFAQQPLLPRRSSQAGPGVICADLDADGSDDLALSNGRGLPLSVFRGDGQGRFVPWPHPLGPVPPQGEVAGMTVWPHAIGSNSLVVALTQREPGRRTIPSAMRIELAPRPTQPQAMVPVSACNPGPVAMADVDGDGDLDLCLGGLESPGRFPEPGGTEWWRQDPDGWHLAQRWEHVGLARGMVLSDLNSDGWPDLILACEWGPIRVWLNHRGQWTEATEALGLKSTTGWWQSVATGDIDGDGRLDIIAGNWGLNSPYARAGSGPWRLAFGDLNEDGGIVPIEYWVQSNDGRAKPSRDLETLTRGFPGLRALFPSHQAFAEADLLQALGNRLSRCTVLEATTLASMVFFNRGNRFVGVELPREAQWTPASHVTVADFDLDGREDVFLSQNFFGLPPHEHRLDAGLGLWLRGAASPSNLQPVSPAESGLLIYGEQRGAAVGDIDSDGRPDLVVTQNSGATRVWRNRLAPPGWRIRLQGPSGNPWGYGAQIRLVHSGGAGPVREWRSSSGRYSQDSATLILPKPTHPTQLQVLWPGGKRTTSQVIPAAAREIIVDTDGQARIVR